MTDLLVQQLIQKELQRQRNHIELIASENFVSMDVLAAAGSILTNKYAEGYPFKRYYGGCEFIDQIEQLAIDRAKQLFGAEHANVQPHSGSQANMAVYAAVLNHGDIVLGMSLDAGGHLTHGHPLSFSGIQYQFHGYSVDPVTEMIDYDKLLEQALLLRPKLIVAGASSYTRTIDFARFRQIADAVGAKLMVDMAHIAGLVATGEHLSPIPYADFVTSTTHKTLRGPRGGLILCKAEYAPILDKRIFPGIQGGPLEHIIAAKAVCFGEALGPSFQLYQQQVRRNARALGDAMKAEGFRLVAGGTDNHMILVDLREFTPLTGKEVETLLDRVGITLNKNSIPFDTRKPVHTSGIRLGTPAMTTRGFMEADFVKVAQWIARAIKNVNDLDQLAQIRDEVEHYMTRYPLYPSI